MVLFLICWSEEGVEEAEELDEVDEQGDDVDVVVVEDDEDEEEEESAGQRHSSLFLRQPEQTGFSSLHFFLRRRQVKQPVRLRMMGMTRIMAAQLPSPLSFFCCFFLTLLLSLSCFFG